MFEQYSRAKRAGLPCRSVFVTGNSTLRNKLSDLFARHRWANFGERKKQGPKVSVFSLQNLTASDFPLFVTGAELVMALDRLLVSEKRSFFTQSEHKAGQKVVGLAYESGSISSLQKLKVIVNEGTSTGSSNTNGMSRKLKMSNVVRNEMNFNRFSKQLQQDGLTQNQIAAIYRDIHSYIKGSKEALFSKKGCLSEKQYLNMSKKASVSSAGNRKVWYEFFEKCEKKKKSNNDFDVLDVIHHIFTELKSPKGLNMELFDGLFVDECQDFSQSILILLSSLVKDINTILMAGDRYQTITRGINFNFKALGALLYSLKTEERDRNNDKHKNNANNANNANNTNSNNDSQAEVKYLVRNWRCHSGILKLSNVVKKMLLLFPNLVDKAVEEVSYFNGPKAELLEDIEIRELFPHVRENNHSQDFGADMGILVRDNNARVALLKDAPELENALVLTILEAKGLEFNTVVLCNFWKDSIVDDWMQRLLFHVIEKILSLSSKDKVDEAEWKSVFMKVMRERIEEVSTTSRPKSNVINVTNNFNVGDRCLVHHLESEAGQLLNGQHVTLKAKVPNGRFKCKFDDGTFKQIKTCNLQIINGDRVNQTTDGFDSVSRFARSRMKTVSINGGTKFVPEINFEEMYGLLADELKQLYVAITRSRSRIVIFDQDRNKREPFYLLCQLTGATSPASLDSYNYGDGSDSNTNQKKIQKNKRELTSEEIANERAKWNEKGELLLSKQFYERAALCFKNAHALEQCRKATADMYLDQAMQAVSASQKSSAFYQAGLRFLMTEQYDEAKESFRRAGYQDLANHKGFNRGCK